MAWQPCMPVGGSSRHVGNEDPRLESNSATQACATTLHWAGPRVASADGWCLGIGRDIRAAAGSNGNGCGPGRVCVCARVRRKEGEGGGGIGEMWRRWWWGWWGGGGGGGRGGGGGGGGG